MDEPLPVPVPPAEENTITFKRSHLYAVLLPLAFVVGLSVGYLFWGRASPTSQPEQAAASSSSGVPAVAQSQGTPSTSGAASPAGPQQVQRYDVPVDDDPSIGLADAQITIIEFSDYECPYCTKWRAEVWPRLQETYSTQLRLVYRDFPLTSIHSNAAMAAEAANCAQEQGKYWEYHDLLFSGAYGLGESAYLKYAQDLGMDQTALKQCLDDRRYQAEVEADYNYAAELGIRSTPTFFVNGIAIVGAQPFEVFQQLIDLELAGKLSQ